MDQLGAQMSLEAQMEIQTYMAEMDLRAHQERIEDMSAQCFESCVVDMYNRDLAEKERDCIRKCSGKYLNVYLRCMERWQEIQIQQAQAMSAQQQQMLQSLTTGGDESPGSS